MNDTGDAILGPTLTQILLFRGGYNTSVVLAGTAVLGVAAGVIGAFALLRKRAMTSDAISHATLPGLAGAFLIATFLGHQGRSAGVLLSGAALAAVLGGACVQGIVRTRRLRDDAAVGIVLSGFFALGVVLLSWAQSLPVGTQGGLHHFLLGQTAAMSLSDAYLLSGVAGAAVLVCAVLFKELRLICFDEEFARVGGRRVGLVDGVLTGLIVAVIVVGMQAVGLVLIVAMLIIPAAAARLWTQRLALMVVISAIVGGLSGYVGSALSAVLPRFPTGAVIVLTAGAFFTLSLALAPERGVIASAVRRAALRLRTGRQHLLRSIGERDAAGAAPVAQLEPARAWSHVERSLILLDARLRGLATTADGTVRLTPAGQAEARRLAHAHRLWERYLMASADRASWNVHATADLAEHAMDPALVAELERQIAEAEAHRPERGP